MSTRITLVCLRGSTKGSSWAAFVALSCSVSLVGAVIEGFLKGIEGYRAQPVLRQGVGVTWVHCRS
jgi:hypothetical protein